MTMIFLMKYKTGWGRDAMPPLPPNFAQGGIGGLGEGLADLLGHGVRGSPEIRKQNKKNENFTYGVLGIKMW